MLQHLSVRRQLGLAFACVIGIFMLVGVAVGLLVVQLQRGAQHFERDTLPQVLALDEMALAVEKVQQFLTDVGATHDPGAYAEADEAAKDFRQRMGQFRDRFQRDGDTARLQTLDQLGQRFDAFEATGRRMAQAYIDQGLEAGNALMKGRGGEPGFDQRSEELIKALEAFRNPWLDTAREQAAQASQQATRALWVLGGGLVLATVLGLVFARYITACVYRLLGAEPQAAARLASEVGSGNLVAAGEAPTAAPGSLMQQLHAMQASLVRVVQQVHASSRGVADASAQIVSDNGNLSQQTQAQVSGVQQAHSALTMLRDAVSASAGQAGEATALANATADLAERGGTLVNQVVQNMAGIREASQKIADIIGVVDSIAFQTNILALNAAVEAARAGEQGRGFAVVAGEVRTLASRTAAAAREVKTLIGSNVERVQGGTNLVEQAGGTINDVVQGIQRLRQLMEQIHAASAEQVADMAQVSQAMQHIDAATQRNSALVQHMSGASDSLDEQARALLDSVQAFRVQPA